MAPVEKVVVAFLLLTTYLSLLSSDEDEPEHVRQSLPPIPSLDEEDNSDNELVSDNENETLPEA